MQQLTETLSTISNERINKLEKRTEYVGKVIVNLFSNYTKHGLSIFVNNMFVIISIVSFSEEMLSNIDESIVLTLYPLLKVQLSMTLKNIFFIMYMPNNVTVDNIENFYERFKKILNPVDSATSGLHNVVMLCNDYGVHDTKLKDVFYFLDIQDKLNDYDKVNTDKVIKEKLTGINT